MLKTRHAAAALLRIWAGTKLQSIHSGIRKKTLSKLKDSWGGYCRHYPKFGNASGFETSCLGLTLKSPIRGNFFPV